MALRTVVRMTVRNEDLDEAHNALVSLNGPGVAEVTRNPGAGGTTAVTTRLPGDAREHVAEKLAKLTSLPYDVEIVEGDL
ncbi:hypothetical protein [Streptomyces zaomyceticus]|uniref:hypothetical protein n=1 Tax=Streptomyces zaomyceticus TaxID=68286 RepID=UPI0037B439AB